VRRTLVSSEIARRIGACLSRNGSVRVIANVHDLPQQYERFRLLRDADDDRLFLFFDSVIDDGRIHLFTFLVDDATSDLHLIVKNFEHESRAIG
jgi:hypothetical protein